MKQKGRKRKRDQLISQLLDPSEMLRGSLLERRIRHRRGCRKCARGEGHPVLVLTVTFGAGKVRPWTVPAGKRKQVERYLGN